MRDSTRGSFSEGEGTWNQTADAEGESLVNYLKALHIWKESRRNQPKTTVYRKQSQIYSMGGPVAHGGEIATLGGAITRGRNILTEIARASSTRSSWDERVLLGVAGYWPHSGKLNQTDDQSSVLTPSNIVPTVYQVYKRWKNKNKRHKLLLPWSLPNSRLPETPIHSHEMRTLQMMSQNIRKRPSISIGNKYQTISNTVQRRYPWIQAWESTRHLHHVYQILDDWFKSSLPSCPLHSQSPVQSSYDPEVQKQMNK